MLLLEQEQAYWLYTNVGAIKKMTYWLTILLTLSVSTIWGQGEKTSALRKAEQFADSVLIDKFGKADFAEFFGRAVSYYYYIDKKTGHELQNIGSHDTIDIEITKLFVHYSFMIRKISYGGSITMVIDPAQVLESNYNNDKWRYKNTRHLLTSDRIATGHLSNILELAHKDLLTLNEAKKIAVDNGIEIDTTSFDNHYYFISNKFHQAIYRQQDSTFVWEVVSVLSTKTVPCHVMGMVHVYEVGMLTGDIYATKKEEREIKFLCH